MKHRFYVPNEYIKNDKVLFSKKQEHKISKVLRLSKNESVIVCDGNGIEYVVKSNTKDIVSEKKFKNISKIYKRIIIGLPKFNKFEVILQKCVEIGVDEIIPVISDRSVVKVKDTEKKRERFNEIIVSAFCQCRRKFMPLFSNIYNAIDELPDDIQGLKISFYENAKINRFKEVLENNHQEKEITIFVGPEGGITTNEVEILEKKGFLTCMLTNNILRCETAVIYALSCLNFFYE